MVLNLKNRVKKLEEKARGDVPPQVAAWIDSAMFFDELTPAQQTIYCRYRWNTEEPPDKWFAGVVPGVEYSEHFQLDRRPPPPTKAEFEQNIREVQAYMEQASREFAEEQEQKKGVDHNVTA